MNQSLQRHSRLQTLGIAACFLFAGFIVAHAAKPIETLHGVQWAEDGLQVLVSSTGCTDSNSFEMVQDQNLVTIVRVKPDHCRRREFTVWVTLNSPMTDAEIRIKNPIKQL